MNHKYLGSDADCIPDNITDNSSPFDKKKSFCKKSMFSIKRKNFVVCTTKSQKRENEEPIKRVAKKGDKTLKKFNEAGRKTMLIGKCQ